VQLNACLDLDKHEAQIVDEPREAGEGEPTLPSPTRSRSFRLGAAPS
jgi:hypothetical protein